MKTGKLIATKKRDALYEIEKITGLTFDQFTRSILLAQGGFAAFLEANRMSVRHSLSRITGLKFTADFTSRCHQHKCGKGSGKLGTVKATRND